MIIPLPPPGVFRGADGSCQFQVWAPEIAAAVAEDFCRADGSCQFQVWAPHHSSLDLVLETSAGPEILPMQAGEFGWWQTTTPSLAVGCRYQYRFADGTTRPDPASRWQPDGVHQASAVYFPEDFPWQVATWQPRTLEELVIYELHVGTFTNVGTFAAVIERLPELVDLGITAIEILPVAQFAGPRNWGYDGVYPFAVQNNYGGPAELQRLVDAAHGLGLLVILDVVYNHLGPEGNYLGQFGPYFTNKYGTPWGQAINYDSAGSEPVRRYFIENALMWLRDFRCDGLRLDATQMIFDNGPTHILEELQAEVRQLQQQLQRPLFLIPESDQNNPRLVDAPDIGGFGHDAMWSDDLHHALHVAVTGEQNGYYADFAGLEHLARTLQNGYSYDGTYSRHRQRRFGRPFARRSRSQLVGCIQNHDQVGNRARGDRLESLVPASACRAAATILLLAPHTPLLFMGEEYGEDRPFPFFCSFPDAGLVEPIRLGRAEEFKAFGEDWSALIPDPFAQTTFQSAILSWRWQDDPNRAGRRQLYRDLLLARRTWPSLQGERMAQSQLLTANGSGTDPDQSGTTAPLFLQMVRQHSWSTMVLLANLHPTDNLAPVMVTFNKAPSWSSEQTDYGGSRQLNNGWERVLLPYEVCIWTTDL